MLVFKKFNTMLEKLNLLERKKLLCALFNLEVVYLYSCEEVDGVIEIKLYNGSYYRFRFYFDGEVQETFFDVRLSKMYNYIDINVNKFRNHLDIFDNNNKFFNLMKWFLEEDISYLEEVFRGCCLYSNSRIELSIDRE